MPPRFLSILVALVLTMPAAAEDLVRLSPADREAALAAAADAPINGAPGAGDGKIHGEMAMTIGSGGLRAVSGSTLLPLGETGTLGLAFATTQAGRWRAR